MKVPKKIENELWMMVELNGKPSIREKKRIQLEDKMHVIGCLSRVISCYSKYVDPKKIN